MSIFYRQISTMGTRLELVIPGLEEDRGTELVRRVKDSLDLLNSKISNYQPDSELSKVNRLRAGESISVRGELLELISAGSRYNGLTRGYFDFTLGGWTSPPDRIADTGRRLRELLDVPFNERFILHGDLFTKHCSDVRIDSGGIGKGMALEGLEKTVRSFGIHSAFISFGGSSVLGVGTHPYGHAWKVGIRHPLKAEVVAEEVDLVDSSLSVSGNSLNNRRKYGETGHILDPLTGQFCDGLDMAIAVSRNPVEAEMLSTAMMAAGKNGEAMLKNQFPDVLFKRYEFE